MIQLLPPLKVVAFVSILFVAVGCGHCQGYEEYHSSALETCQCERRMSEKLCKSEQDEAEAAGCLFEWEGLQECHIDTYDDETFEEHCSNDEHALDDCMVE